MGIRLRTDGPQMSNLHVPDWPHLHGFSEKDAQYKKLQKEQYDRRHRTKPVASLPDDTEVWVNVESRQITSRVNTNLLTPRSYLIALLMYQLAKLDEIDLI